MSDLREDLRAAMTETSATEPAPEPVPEPVEAAPVEAEPNEPTEVAEAPAEKSGRVRGPDGKFKARAAEAITVAPAEPAAVAPAKVEPVAAPVVAATPKYKPPQSWKPAAREEWSKLPESIQAEIDRREREVPTALSEAATARKFHEEFRQATAAYAPLLGHEPVKAIGGLLQSVHVLQSGPPLHKAQLVAQMIKGYGVDVQTLAQLLDGETPQQGPAQAVDPNAIAQQVRQQLEQQWREQQKQAGAAKAQQELQAFLSSGKAEFYEDVKPLMGQLLSAGVAKNLEDAYNAAVKLNPETSSVLQQREAAKQANAATASTQRARAAASSVKSQPAGPVSRPPPDDIRGALRESIQELTRGK